MIRKPPADWNRLHEGAAIRTVRTASAVAKGGADVARRGGQAMTGLLCYFLAAIWGFFGIASGLATGSLPMIIGIGVMAALMCWAGHRALAKARETSG